MPIIRNIIRLVDWIGRFQMVQAFAAAKWPAGLAMLIFGVGVAQGQPYMWILMATSLGFMGIAVGFVYVNAWREKNSPLNKIHYSGTLVNYDLVPPNTAQALLKKSTKQNIAHTRKLDKTQVGVALQNYAAFPISIILASAETKMEGKKPPRPETPYPRPPVMLLPGNTVMMMDDPIAMEGLECQKLEGEMKLKIKYGFLGKEIYELNFAGRVEAMMRPEGFITGTYTHWESAQIGIE